MRSLLIALTLAFIATPAHAVFYFLDTSTTAGRGEIYQTQEDGSGKTLVGDLDPSPFGAIEAWHGFATDGDFFYLLQTGHGNPNLGRVDRINMDGTGRTTIVDVDPSPFGAIENYHGFAAFNPVPEPATATLGLLALCGLAMRRRRIA